MDNKTAGALALALVAGVAGLGMVPGAAASADCVNDDFTIPAVKPLTARALSASASEVGRTDVTSLAAKTLSIELDDAGDAGVLTWMVFHVVASQCVQYTAGECDENNVLDAPQTVSCQLNAPSSGTKPYWVFYEETGDANAIDYFTWAAEV